MSKPPSEKRAVDLVINKINRLNNVGEIVGAMDFSSRPNVNSDFITDFENQLASIQTLLNTVNERLNELISNKKCLKQLK